MSENPYAPPGADLGDELRRGTEGRGDFDIGECLSDGWTNLWANFPLWLGVGLVGTVAMVLSLVSLIGIVFLVPVLVWGGTYFMLRMHDGGAEFGDLFAGFSRYGAALVGMLGCMVLLFLVGLIGQAVQIVGQLSENETLALIGVTVNMLFSLFVSARLGFAYFYIVDTGMGPVEALSRSWSDTAPVMWKVVGLFLLGGLIVVAGALLLIVGAIPASVLFYLMWVSAYRQLVGHPAAV